MVKTGAGEKHWGVNDTPTENPIWLREIKTVWGCTIASHQLA